MKYKINLAMIIYFCTATSFSQIITVKQNGSGDYENIQDAVDAAANGDTVLVWPGTYQENVHIEEKDIVLGSLTLTSGDISYAYQTIIDGNHNGGCIWIDEVNFAEINGFTTIHGFGNDYTQMGGGILVYRSDYAEIKNCIIRDNQALFYGAGIMFYNTDGFISGCIIKNNHSYTRGGGICVLNAELVFDSLNPCSIFLNYAGMGTDFYKLVDGPPIHLYLDTATVIQPDHYYLYSDKGSGYPVDDITYSVSNAAIEQVKQNLYVSPEGDNNNSGLSAAEPLKHLSFALLKIASDSLDPDTIFLAHGIYAPSAGEKIPVNLKAWVSIVGESRDSVILDGQYKFHLIKGNPETHHHMLKNMTIQHGNGNEILAYHEGAFLLDYNNHSSFENLLFRRNTGTARSAGTIFQSNDFMIKNIEFVENTGGPALDISTHHTDDDPPFRADTVRVINCRFHDQSEDSLTGIHGIGQAMIVSSEIYPDSLTCYISNTEFLRTISTPDSYGITANALTLWGSKTYVTNCTFADNSIFNSQGGAVGLVENANMFIYNSILYNNHPAQLWLKSNEGTPTLGVYNSLVEDGALGIKIFTCNFNLDFDEQTNIDADPLFSEMQPYPYSLSYGSPCINTGTLDLPPGVELPETDLAGNPRVWDGQIDMGAYEYGPWVGVYYRPPAPPAPQITAAPNPFIYQTTITYEVKEKGKQQVRVYDLRGNLVSTLLDVTGQPGSGSIRWSAADSFGNELPAGVYVVELIVNGENRGSVKVVKR